MRKTKIICTLGPATDSDEVLISLCKEGMNVARFNFSHGDEAQHRRNMERIQNIRTELKLPIGTLLDTKGPEIRLGTFKEGKVELEKGQIFSLNVGDIEGTDKGVSISYKELIQDITVGNKILIDDGLLELEVVRLTENEIVCVVINGGIVSDYKGVNVPGVSLNMPYISEKDRRDIQLGVKMGFDFIAASFTRTAHDILEIRKELSKYQANQLKVIAKIENIQGVENIDEIIRVADGIMIARGDLGVEIPLQEVPVIQKKIIKKVCEAEKPVITATQMLDSMMKHPRPTRAEATDVANAIYDGTSAIMLSGETAAGLYPVEALKTMVKIATRAEEDIDYRERFRHAHRFQNNEITGAISHATCTTALDLNAAAIITVTKSGKTARMISRYRPECMIIGCSTEEHVCRQMNLSWGVVPLMIEEKNEIEVLFNHAADMAEKAGLVKAGDITVLTSGIPLCISGTSNLIKVHMIGHVLMKGRGIVNKAVCARLCICHSEEECHKKFKKGDIIVIHETSNGIIEELKEAAAVITELDGVNSHAAIVGLTLDIPVILGVEQAVQRLKSGALVIVDGNTGQISSGNDHEKLGEQ